MNYDKVFPLPVPPHPAADALDIAAGALRDLDSAGHSLRHAVIDLSFALREGDSETASYRQQHVATALMRYEQARATADRAIDRAWTALSQEPTP